PDAEQVDSSRAGVACAHHPPIAQRSLNTRIELESIRILQLVVECLQLIQDVVWVEAPQKVWKRRGHDRRALRERRIRAAGEIVILGKNLAVKGAECGPD